MQIDDVDPRHPEHPLSNLKLLSNIVWSAAVFEHQRTPIYRKMMQLLPACQDRDRHCKRRIQEVRHSKLSFRCPSHHVI